MKKYLPVIIAMILLALPLSAQADGFFGLFGKDKQAEQNDTTQKDGTIYNKTNADSSSRPIFLNGKDGNRTRRTNSNQNTYNKYNSPLNDTADEMPEHFRIEAERIEAEEKARLAERQAERQRLVDENIKEQEAWLKELERQELEEFNALKREEAALRAAIGITETDDGDILRSLPEGKKPREKDESEDDTVKYIYKKPEKNSEPSRVFKNFR